MTQDKHTIEQRAKWVALIESLDSGQLSYIYNTLWREMYTDLNENPLLDDQARRQSIKALDTKLSKLFIS
jgi:hypothetical protein